MNNRQIMIPSLIPVAKTSNVNKQSSNIESNVINNKLISVSNYSNFREIVKQTDLEQIKNEENLNPDQENERITKIQQPSYSSSNLKIKIYHSSNDLKVDNKTDNISTNAKSNFPLHTIQNKKNIQSKILKSKTDSFKDRTLSAKDLSKSYEILQVSDTFQQNKVDIYQRQISKQLKEKELTITEISRALNEKEKLIANLYFEVNDKSEKILELQDEIKKRKYDMNEMSRRIIDLNQELKLCQCRKYRDYDWKPLSRSLSRLSINSLNPDDKSNNKWIKIPGLNKALKKMIQKRNDGKNPTGDCIDELKSILQEKEMLITELRLESKLTNQKLFELENTLKKRDEESFVIKRNNEYFEKIFKSKLIE